MLLAWQSIVDDAREMKLVLDNLQIKNAQKSLKDAQQVVMRVTRDTYRWLLAPMQEVKGGAVLPNIQWEAFPVSPTAQNLTQEVERVLRENELLITEWSPIHLRRVLVDWYWRDGKESAQALTVWQDTGRYLYLPRLRDEGVFHQTLAAGAASEDFFGISYGKDGDKWEGFSLGRATSPILDDSLLLVEPKAAAAYAAKVAAEKAAAQPEGGPPYPLGGGGTDKPANEPPAPPLHGGATSKAIRKRFYGTIDLDPVRAKLSFAQVVDEVVQQFTTKHNVAVKISVEIEATTPTSFDDATQRAVRENCTVLKFGSASFEEE